MDIDQERNHLGKRLMTDSPQGQGKEGQDYGNNDPLDYEAKKQRTYMVTA
jgi:hypothetical protein